jgi:nucleoside 2-deoxyribosyltransferase
VKIYIAGRYSRRDEFREVAKQLIEMGHEVTSRWLDEEISPDHTMSDLTADYSAKAARHDLDDIDEAAVVLFFAEDVMTPRGGRHVEFGYALAMGKFIYVIGPRENIFHYSSMVYNIPNVEYLAPSKVVGF